MISLYTFQEKYITELRRAIAQGSRHILLVSPTGSGKTVTFAYLVSRMAERGVAANIMAHRQELLQQIGDTLDKFNCGYGLIASGEDMDPSSLTQVSSVFTAVRRINKIPIPKYVIVDEAHHCIAGSTWHKCIDAWGKLNPDLVVIGVTATPERLSGDGLGQVFDKMIVGPGTGELIEAGFLSPYKIFAPKHQMDTSQLHMQGGDYKRDETEALVNKPSITGDAVAHYRKHLNGAPSVAFCVSIKHAWAVAESFRANGFRAAHIDGTMEKSERRKLVADFGAGRLNVLTSCDLISEGFDVPGMHGAILLRPTESLALYLQQCGRTLRTAPGKTHAVLLDHVGNSSRHGLPCDEREWSLDSKARKKKKDKDDICIRQCPVCGAVSKATAVQCPECGHVYEVVPRKIDEVEGELSEVDIETARLQKRREQGQAESIEALVQLGRMRGMKSPHGWAKHVWEARVAKRRRA